MSLEILAALPLPRYRLACSVSGSYISPAPIDGKWMLIVVATDLEFAINHSWSSRVIGST